MPILTKKLLVPLISLTAFGGVYLTKSFLLSKHEEKVISKVEEREPSKKEPEKPNLKTRFQSKNTGRVLINQNGHDRVWNALLEEYKQGSDENIFPISKDQVTMQQFKKLCASLEQSTEEEKLSQYEKYCTRVSWKNHIKGLIDVGDTITGNKQKQKYKDSNSLPIAALNGNDEKLPEGCESKYQEPYDDQKNESDYGHLKNGCVWNDSTPLS